MPLPPAIAVSIFTPDSPFSLIMTARWLFGFFTPLIVARSSPSSLSRNTLHPVNLCASTTQQRKLIPSQRDRSAYTGCCHAFARHLSREETKEEELVKKCRSINLVLRNKVLRMMDDGMILLIRGLSYEQLKLEGRE